MEIQFKLFIKCIAPFSQLRLLLIMILAYKRLTSESVWALTTLLLYLHVLISTGNLSIAFLPVQ